MWTWNCFCFELPPCWTISCSQILQNAWINNVVHWKFWGKYRSVSYSFSCNTSFKKWPGLRGSGVSLPNFLSVDSFHMKCLLLLSSRGKKTSKTFQFHSNLTQIQFQIQFKLTQILFQIQTLLPFSKGFKRFQKVPKLSKNKQTNKQTQFKSSDDLVKSETNCNDVFLKRKRNYINGSIS